MQRKGTVLLMLLVALMIGGIVAIRLVPSIEIQERRQKGVQLKLALSQIRQAFAMYDVASSSYTFTVDLSTPGKIEETLSHLVQENLLLASASLRDRHVPGHRWGAASGLVYWKKADNIASNTSFETDSAWILAPETVATYSPIYLDHPAIDDFPGENKLGIPLGLTGHSLCIR